MKSTAELVQIVSFGGGLVLDAGTKSADELVQIASFAAGKGSRVFLKNVATKSTAELVRIASFGKGVVVFDLTE